MIAPRNLKNVTDFKILCDGYVIKGSEIVKFLGVCIVNVLSFKNIVFNIVQKVNARLNFYTEMHPVIVHSPKSVHVLP